MAAFFERVTNWTLRESVSNLVGELIALNRGINPLSLTVHPEKGESSHAVVNPNSRDDRSAIAG